MLEVQITGDAHPKTVTIVSDDKEAENARLTELIEETWGADDHLAQTLRDSEMDSDGKLRFIIPNDQLWDFAELIESDWPIAADQIQTMIREGVEAGHQKGDQ